MQDPSGVWLLCLLVVGVVVLTFVQRHHTARVREDRGRLFEDCSGLVEGPVLVSRGLDFPLLTGRRAGHDVRLEPVVDTLSMRTLPVLWLVVTVRGPHASIGRLSVLARACGTEFYARHDEAGAAVAMGPHWPDELAVRADNADVAARQPHLLDRIRAFMADARVKQVVVGPTSARVVWRCATAESATYRVTRRVDLTQARVDASALAAVLDTMDEMLALPGEGTVTAAVEPEETLR